MCQIHTHVQCTCMHWMHICTCTCMWHKSHKNIRDGIKINKLTQYYTTTVLLLIDIILPKQVILSVSSPPSLVIPSKNLWQSVLVGPRMNIGMGTIKDYIYNKCMYVHVRCTCTLYQYRYSILYKYIFLLTITTLRLLFCEI